MRLLLLIAIEEWREMKWVLGEFRNRMCSKVLLLILTNTTRLIVVFSSISSYRSRISSSVLIEIRRVFRYPIEISQNRTILQLFLHFGALSLFVIRIEFRVAWLLLMRDLLVFLENRFAEQWHTVDFTFWIYVAFRKSDHRFDFIPQWVDAFSHCGRNAVTVDEAAFAKVLLEFE